MQLLLNLKTPAQPLNRTRFLQTKRQVSSLRILFRALSEVQETVFRFVRDYETVKVEQDVPNEFLLVLDDGPSKEEVDDAINGVGIKPHRPKGAYYKNIERKMILKKKRANVSTILPKLLSFF